MKAIVLAAGQGTRLRPLTDDRPKALVPFRGVPLLVHARDALARAGVTEQVVVTGYRADTIAALGFQTVFNPAFATTNMVRSLFCAREHLRGGFLVVYGDILFKASIIEQLLRADAPLALAVNTQWRELWAQRMANPLDDAETLKLDASGAVIELGKKPTSYADVQAQYAGLVKVSAEAADDVLAFYDALPADGRWDGRPLDGMFMTSFLQALIDSGRRVLAVPFEGGWAEVDSPEDLAVAERLPANFFEG